MHAKKLRWGIMGCANIAITAVIPAILQSKTGEVTAIASRQEQKAKETAAKLGIPKTYGSYEQMLADADIDAIYIPLPNHLHYEWMIKAAEAGKHVLCEKPLALDAQQAEKMIQASSKAGILLVEAFMYRHHPRYDQIKQIMVSGEIGVLRGIRGAFTFNNAEDLANVRFQSSMGGGSLYDVGCYPIHAARYLLDLEPEAVTVQAFYSQEHDNVDMMVSGLIEFPHQIGLTFDCGMWAEFRNTIELLGTEGRIEIPCAFLSPLSPESNFFVTVKGKRREEQVEHVNQYVLQIDDFGHSVLNGTPFRFPADDAVKNMRVIDACMKSANERSRVTL
ncbi:MAG: oxidoreductase protein [Bacilli bacterium]|jgi:xylose dehydrogenase (NAD/NADP)|nr:oxidoreductase protein [Bacilli bacterium]